MRSAGTLLLAALLVAFFVAGCRNDRIRVHMEATSDGASRSFASNALKPNDVDRLRQVYAAEPEADRDVGGKRFTGAFGHDLPSEVGNKNGLTELRTRLGSSRFYFESFAAGSGLWSELETRMHAGELWLRLFGRWAGGQIEDPSKREEWKSYVEREMIPLIDDSMLLWSAQLATVRAARVAQDVRDSRDGSPVTDDERFAQKVGMPLLLLLAERGFLTAEETQRLFLVSLDGNPAKAERTWVVDQVLMPALLRQVHRFRPNAKALDAAELAPMAMSFWLYATTSPDRREILLASPAISEADKSSLRAGNAIVSLPAPFGFDVLSQAKRTDADVRLRTGTRPFAHNGQWDESTGEVRFVASFAQPGRRTTLFPPVFFAAWSEPDEPMQERLFGSILLSGNELAEYCIWREALPANLAMRWEKALDELERDGTVTAIAGIERQVRDVRPLPKPLVEWLRLRTQPRATG